MRNFGYTSIAAVFCVTRHRMARGKGAVNASGDWRRSLRRTIGGLLALKLVALLLIKMLLFPADRAPNVDAALVSRQLGLAAMTVSPEAMHD